MVNLTTFSKLLHKWLFAFSLWSNWSYLQIKLLAIGRVGWKETSANETLDSAVRLAPRDCRFRPSCRRCCWRCRPWCGLTSCSFVQRSSVCRDFAEVEQRKILFSHFWKSHIAMRFSFDFVVYQIPFSLEKNDFNSHSYVFEQSFKI
jgi:hypothetical protein